MKEYVWPATRIAGGFMLWGMGLGGESMWLWCSLLCFALIAFGKGPLWAKHFTKVVLAIVGITGVVISIVALLKVGL